VFLVNSRLGLVTAAPSRFGSKCLHANGAPLLPKLRGNFAEFLNEGSPDRLGILYLPTCVGLGTGTRNLPRGFSWRHGFRDLGPCGLSRHPVSVLRPARFTTGPPTRLRQDYQRLDIALPTSSPHRSNGRDVVPEYQPVVHRLRLSASA
jgi:hypothetical protein